MHAGAWVRVVLRHPHRAYESNSEEQIVRFIPTRIHGMLDYGMGILLVAAPWLLGFARGEAETWVPVILGLAVILYSLFTDYELGLVRKLSMPAHLVMDALGGMLLALSPWLFGFSEFVWVPHLVFGILEIGAALFTRTVPSFAPPAGAGSGRRGA